LLAALGSFGEVVFRVAHVGVLTVFALDINLEAKLYTTNP
jgi:hypothetical protein